MAKQVRSRHSKASHREPSETRLRVIGGDWRSRVLPVANRPGLRPTPNRVRETLFNWLAPRIEGSTCLDLFAGTGALGIEALSRGAARAVFVERDRQAAAAIDTALNTLGAKTRGDVVIGDACTIARPVDMPRVDIVFIDPPFDARLHHAALDGIAPLLDHHSRVYLEYPADETDSFIQSLGDTYDILRQICSGGVGYCLVRPTN